MRTTWPSRMACRHGPLSSSYWTSSTLAATGSLQATVTGRPLDRMVIPHDRSPHQAGGQDGHFMQELLDTGAADYQ